MPRRNNAAADEGEAKAGHGGEEHDRVACGIGGACPRCFRHTEGSQAPEKAATAQENEDQPAALGRHVDDDEEHGEAGGVREQRPRRIGRLEERLEEVGEDGLWVVDAEEVELEGPPEGGKEHPADAA